MFDFVVPPVPRWLNVLNAIVTATSVIATVAYAIFVRSKEREKEQLEALERWTERIYANSSGIVETIIVACRVARQTILGGLYGRTTSRMFGASAALTAVYVIVAGLVEYRSIRPSLSAGRRAKAAIEERIDPHRGYTRPQIERAHEIEFERFYTDWGVKHLPHPKYDDPTSRSIRAAESGLTERWEREAAKSPHARSISFLVLTEGLDFEGYRGPMIRSGFALYCTNVILDFCSLQLVLFTVAALEKRSRARDTAVPLGLFAVGLAVALVFSIAGAAYFESGVLTFYSTTLIWLPLCAIGLCAGLVFALVAARAAWTLKEPGEFLGVGVVGAGIGYLAFQRLRDVVGHVTAFGPPPIQAPSTSYIGPWVLAATSASPALILVLALVTGLVMHALLKSSWLYLRVGVQNSPNVAAAVFLFPTLVLNAVKGVWEVLPGCLPP